MKATTLHSLAMQVLKWYDEYYGKLKLVTVTNDGDYELCKKLRNALNKWVKEANKQYPTKMTVNKAKKTIEKLSGGEKATNDAERYIRRKYQQWFINANRNSDITITDYSQAITTATKLLNKEWRDEHLMVKAPDNNHTVFPQVKVLLVDEAQDLNKQQQQFIEALRPEWLTAVGDPLQAIYKFQGADPTWLENFENKISLRHDYRSTNNIVKQCAAIANNNMIAAPNADEGTPVKMYNAQNETEEDQWVINEAKALLKAGLSDNLNSENGITILTRESNRGKRILNKLREEKLEDSIEISTVHKYKGLQKAAIFILGLSEQTWNKDNNEDARNCFYVALSRAKTHLYLSYAREEIINNRARATTPLKLIKKLNVQEVTVNSTSKELTKTIGRQLEEDLEQEYEKLNIRKKAALRVAGTYHQLSKRYQEAEDSENADKMDKRSNEIKNCMTLAVFSRSVKKTENENETNEELLEPRWSFKTADQCGKRTCPPCIWRKSKQLELKLSVLNWWAITGNAKQHTNEADPMRLQAPLFLTATVPNVPADKLKTAMRIINEAWRIITHVTGKDAQIHSKRWGTWNKAIPGWWKTIEITYNEETKMYHPHLHVYMLATKYYANAYNQDDPNMEGKTWVWKDKNDHRKRKGSPYYMTSAQWGELWTKAVHQAEEKLSSKINNYKFPAPAESVGYYLVDIRKTYTDTKRQEGATQAGIAEVANQHFNHTIPNKEAMQKASTYVTKQIQILPPNIEGDELLDWLDTLDNALNGAQLYAKGGWLKRIDEKAQSDEGVIDWQAENPREAEPLPWNELVNRYTHLQESTRREDATSRATWNGDQYIERAITGAIADNDTDSTNTEITDDFFTDDDDEF